MKDGYYWYKGSPIGITGNSPEWCVLYVLCSNGIDRAYHGEESVPLSALDGKFVPIEPPTE